MILPAFHRIRYSKPAYPSAMCPETFSTIVLATRRNTNEHLQKSALSFPLVGYEEEQQAVTIILFELDDLESKFKDLGPLDISEELTHPWELIRQHGLERLRNAKRRSLSL